jgi:hypothetical protein
MPNDGLGVWTIRYIDGSHVEWRRRLVRAEDAHHGTQYVVDISIDGKPPRTGPDFNEILDSDHELALRVRELKAQIGGAGTSRD